MDTHKLAHMANQIARNLQVLPEDEAVAAIADHLKKFWSPSMWRALSDSVSDDAANELSPRCQQALKRLK
jgi:formate dehydrogenase subunit delta